MARDNSKGGLDDPFKIYSEGVADKVNPQTEQKNLIEELNSETEQKNLTETVNSNTEPEHISETDYELKQYHQRLMRITKEDTHTRETFLLENSLRARLKEACKGKKKGFKNAILNDAVRDMLIKLEKNT